MRAPGTLPMCLMLALAALPAGASAQLLSPGELSTAHHALEGDAHCLDCHSSGKRIDDQLCLQCHRDVGATLRAGTGLHGKQYRGKPCAQCHVEHRGASYDLTRWPGGSEAKLDHALTGWPLRGEHAQTKCAECHKSKNERGHATFIGLQTACASCHEDAHEGRFGQTCADCHDERSFKNVRLDEFDHARARFALQGKHAQVECGKCHGAPPEPVKWKGLEFGTCTSCHQDPHQGELGTSCTNCHSEAGWQDVRMKRGSHPGLSILGGHSKVRCAQCHDRGIDQNPSRGSRCVACHRPVHEAKLGNDCAECHRGIQWLGLPDVVGRRAHALTAFPLRGEHEQAECKDCHLPARPQHARYSELAFERCLDCHRDPHQGQLAEHDGGDCRACHDEHGFSPTTFSVEAHAQTDFPLLGRHVAVPCGICHGDPRPRLLFALSGEKQRCESCHQNPHGDQFAAEMREAGCAKCHSSVAWNVPNIDHGTWPLTGAHALVECASCHEATEADRKSGRGASYRGVPRTCEGCHEDVHLGQFRLTPPVRTCDACHRTDSFEVARFDHAKLTRWPLDGKHEQVKCEGCHTTANLRDGKSAVRYRLPFQKCADCHHDPHSEAPP